MTGWGSAGQEGTFELGTDGPTAILVGVDGSTTSLRAGAYAAGLARRQRARLVAVYVEPVVSMTPAVPGAGAALAVAREEAFAQMAGDLGRQAEELARERGINMTFVAARGGSLTRSTPMPWSSGHRPRLATGSSARWRSGWCGPAGGRSRWCRNQGFS